MLGNIGFPTLILIILLALLLFGPSKLPELGRAFGKTLREFRAGTKGLLDEEEEAKRKEEKQTRADAGDNRRLPD